MSLILKLAIGAHKKTGSAEGVGIVVSSAKLEAKNASTRQGYPIVFGAFLIDKISLSRIMVAFDVGHGALDGVTRHASTVQSA